MGSPLFVRRAVSNHQSFIHLHLIPMGGKNKYFSNISKKGHNIHSFWIHLRHKPPPETVTVATQMPPDYWFQAQVSGLEVGCHPGRQMAVGKNLDLYVKITAHCQKYNAYCCCQVAKLCLTLCNPMDCNMPGSFVLHYLLELTQMHVH